MFKNIKSKLLAYILPFVALALLCNYIASVITSKNDMFAQLTLKSEFYKNEQYIKINHWLRNIKNTSQDLAMIYSNTYESVSIEQYNKILENVMNDDKYIVNIGIWFEPDVLDEESQKTYTYVSRNTSQILNYDNLDYLSADFYTSTKSTMDTILFQSPYNDDGDNNFSTITSSSPILDENQNFIGCVTTVFNVEYLQDLVDDFNYAPVHFFIIDNKKMFVKNSDFENFNLHQTLFTTKNSKLTSLIKELTSDQPSTFKLKNNNKNNIVVYDIIPDLNWKLIVVAHETELSSSNTIFYLVTSIIALFFLTFLVITVIDKIVHRPLALLKKEFEDISDNNYNVHLPSGLKNANNEFSIIGKSLVEMKTNLKQYQVELKEQNELLLKSEKYLMNSMNYTQSIINALPQLLFIFSRDGYCTDCQGNQVFKTKPSHHYIGKHISEIIVSEDVEKLSIILKNIKEKETIRELDISYPIEGRIEHFLVNLSHCRDNEIMLVASRITDLRNQLDKVKYLSYHDQITGLCNRRQHELNLEGYVEKKAFPLTIAVCDINGLKLVNDSFGHVEGDNYLLKFAGILKESVVDKNNISRTGGDEFAIIFPKTDKEEALKVVDDIINKISNETIKGIPLSVSFGIDTMYDDNTSINETIKTAEDAMYQRKIYEHSSKKDSTIEIINNALLAKNPREQLHSNRVGILCEKTAKCLGMTRTEQIKLKTAGLLHDIGKIGISEYLLNKPGKLTNEEYKEICKHPEIGYRILEASRSMKEISESVLSHHEKWDGTGYPRQIKGDEISLEARIIAIADTYDAITSERSYRKALSKEDAILELIRCKGTQFEPGLVDLFINKVIKDNGHL